MSNEILLYGEVGTEALSAQSIKTQLASFDQDEELVVRIDSPGGSVFQGLSIYQAFAEYPGPKRCVIESAAFSIASYIAMAFDQIEIAGNGYVMIHNPSVLSDGDDEQHAKDADLLAKLKRSMIEAYSDRTGMPEDQIQSLMQKETYLNASEAKQHGFVSQVLESPVSSRIRAHSDLLPYRVVASLFGGGPSGEVTKPKEKPMADEKKPVAATVKQIKSLFPQAKSEFVVRCMEQELTEEQVAAKAMEELQAENEELQARVAAMEEELEASKAKAAEEEETAKANEEEEHKAKAAAKGAEPVASAGGSPRSASDRWREAIDQQVSKNVPRSRAVSIVNRKYPGLREEMLAEANA